MVNPGDSGTFEFWITDQIRPDVAIPKSGNTGHFETWITDQIWLQIYTEAEGVAVAKGDDWPTFQSRGFRSWRY